MIDVGVTEQHRIDVFRVEGKVLVAMPALIPAALEQTAVEQQRLAGSVQLVHRAGDGSSGAPGAAEWAGSPVPGWRFLKPGETPERGDVAAYKITGCTWGGGPCTGHSGVVVGVSRDGFVTAIAAHEKVIGPDYSFQPSEATYRRYTGD